MDRPLKPAWHQFGVVAHTDVHSVKEALTVVSDVRVPFIEVLQLDVMSLSQIEATFILFDLVKLVAALCHMLLNRHRSVDRVRIGLHRVHAAIGGADCGSPTKPRGRWRSWVVNAIFLVQVLTSWTVRFLVKAMLEVLFCDPAIFGVISDNTFVGRVVCLRGGDCRGCVAGIPVRSDRDLN